MRASVTMVRLAMCLSTLSGLTWGYQQDADGGLVIRQDEESSPTEDSDRSSITSPPSETSEAGNDDDDDNNDDNTDDDRTGTDEETSRRTSSRRTSGTSAVTRTRYPPDAPAGGVTMTTPVTTIEPTPLFKISDYVTLGWNYTSLRGTPTAIDVMISIQNTGTWTLTSNMTFETAVSYVWDTRDQANDPEAPLPNALYTLVIKDSDADVSDIPDPGYLGAYSGFTFGLYTGRAPTPYAEFTCPGCNAASGGFDRNLIGFALTMSIITFLSFTWFVGGVGLH